MNKVIFLLLTVSLFASSCVDNTVSSDKQLDFDLRALITTSGFGEEDFYVLPDEDDLDEIPQDRINNPLTPEKVELGKMLFFETGFATAARKPSGMGTYSCASCHIPEAGFKPGHFQGIADGGNGYGINGEDRTSSSDYQDDEMDVQSARPLSLINVAFVTNTTWNGRFGSGGANVNTDDYWIAKDGTSLNALGYAALETQNIKGLETHRINMTQEVIEDFGYKAMFDAAYPDLTEDERYSNLGGSLAISAYIRTILSNQAPFQKWLKEEDTEAMSLDEKKGAMLFFGKAQCKNCHYEKNLGSNEFHALGVKDMDMRPYYRTTDDELQDRNLGRGAFTGKEEDNYKFKVPQIYNMSDSPFYFHGASVQFLDELLEYKLNAKSENHRVDDSKLSIKFNSVSLSNQEKEQLLLFLNESLRDPNLLRYKPNQILSGNCFPNNDSASRRDIGCN